MAKAQTDRTKVVIRNLPPLLQEADVRALVKDGFQDKVTWFYFVQGKLRWEIWTAKLVLGPTHSW